MHFGVSKEIKAKERTFAAVATSKGIKITSSNLKLIGRGQMNHLWCWSQVVAGLDGSSDETLQMGELMPDKSRFS